MIPKIREKNRRNNPRTKDFEDLVWKNEILGGKLLTFPCLSSIPVMYCNLFMYFFLPKSCVTNLTGGINNVT